MEEPQNRENSGRNPDGTFKLGVSGNPGGRPKNSLKDYVKAKLSEMTDTEKEEYLKQVPKDLQWRMAEGNPQADITSGGEKIQQIPIYGSKSVEDGK